ncbi:hypothetical protein F4604DRAFT_1595823 [Suillus subluteus]|nr:hypothetical protein F4604DRAFT_1595823 [Suillus subluteus]
MSVSFQVPHLCYIAKLPVETLSEIFMLAVHGSFKQRETYEIAPQSVTMPDVLALVNRHWRRVALSDTSLWSTLVVDLHKMICNKTGVGWTWLTTMIRRSGRSSVDIIIKAQQGAASGWRRKYWDFTPTMGRYADCMPAVFNLLFQEMYRWRSLDIVSDTWMPLCSALYLLNERRTEGSGALRLESIKLTRTNDALSSFWHFRPRFIQTVEGIPFAALMGANLQDVPAQSPHLPKLRNIFLYGVHLNWTAFHLATLLSATPTQSLTPTRHCIQSLELSHHSGEVRPTLDEFLGILKACPRLRHLVLRASGPLRGRPSYQVSLPLLQRLHYEFPRVGDPAELFSGFYAPNLIELFIGESFIQKKFTYEDDDEDGPANSLLRYCATHHPFPKLQELSLNKVNAPVEAFSLFMASVPTLRHLSLLGTSNQALRALAPIKDPLTGFGVPCPDLESIKIFPKRRRFDLVDVLRERSKCALRFAEWQCCDLMSDGFMFSFEDNKNQIVSGE